MDERRTLWIELTENQARLYQESATFKRNADLLLASVLPALLRGWETSAEEIDREHAARVREIERAPVFDMEFNIADASPEAIQALLGEGRRAPDPVLHEWVSSGEEQRLACQDDTSVRGGMIAHRPGCPLPSRTQVDRVNRTACDLFLSGVGFAVRQARHVQWHATACPRCFNTGEVANDE